MSKITPNNLYIVIVYGEVRSSHPTIEAAVRAYDIEAAAAGNDVKIAKLVTWKTTIEDVTK